MSLSRRRRTRAVAVAAAADVAADVAAGVAGALVYCYSANNFMSSAIRWTWGATSGGQRGERAGERGARGVPGHFAGFHGLGASGLGHSQEEAPLVALLSI